MPATRVFLYAEPNGACPVIDWFGELAQRDPRALNACLARVRLLAALGRDLRRPYSDMLRDGIYELRARVGTVNYRLLYFYHGKDIAIVSHGLTKEARVPAREIERAIERRKRYEQAPAKHQAHVDL